MNCTAEGLERDGEASAGRNGDETLPSSGWLAGLQGPLQWVQPVAPMMTVWHFQSRPARDRPSPSPSLLCQGFVAFFATLVYGLSISSNDVYRAA